MKNEDKDFPVKDVLEDVVELFDEDGNTVPFELLDVVDYKGTEYAVLFPCDEPDSSEVLIMELRDDPNDPECEFYMPVEDDDLLNEVYNYFKEVNKDNYDFI